MKAYSRSPARRLPARRRDAGPSPGATASAWCSSMPSSAASAASDPSQKTWPTTAACWTSAPLGAAQRVEPRREHGVDGLGQRLGVGRALLDEAVDHLLGEQRVAAGALGDLARSRPSPLPTRRRGSRPPTSSRSSSSPSGSSEIVVALRRPPPQPGRRSSSSSRARQTISSGPAHPARQVLDQVEHSLVGPVDVLDREDQRAGWRDRLDARSGPRRRGARASAAGPRASRRRRLRRRLDAERAARSARRCARRSRPSRRRSTSSSTPRESFAQADSAASVSTISNSAADDLAERPVGDARRRRRGSGPTRTAGVARARRAWS